VGEGEVFAVVELEEFASAHGHACGADISACEACGFGVFDLGAEVEGGGEEVVAENDGGFVAVEVVDGGAAAADVGLVEDVVVDEGGHVDHFADGSGGNVVGGELGAIGEAAQEDEGWAEHLAAVAFDVGNEGLDGCVGGFELVVESARDVFEGLGDGEAEGFEGGREIEDAAHVWEVRREKRERREDPRLRFGLVKAKTSPAVQTRHPLRKPGGGSKKGSTGW
jgi:hypothetical protein